MRCDTMLGLLSICGKNLLEKECKMDFEDSFCPRMHINMRSSMGLEVSKVLLIR